MNRKQKVERLSRKTGKSYSECRRYLRENGWNYLTASIVITKEVYG